MNRENEVDIELIIHLVDLLKFEDLTGFLRKSLISYETNPSEKGKQKLAFDSSMLCLKVLLEDEGLEKTLKMVKEEKFSILDPVIKNKSNIN